MHCSKQSLMGSQLIFSNQVKSLWSLLFKFKQKRVHLFCSVCSFSLGFCLSKDTKPNTHSQYEVVLWHCREVYGAVETNLFFLYKNRSLVLIFLMTCKTIDSPDRFSSITQPRYETVWYCLICTAPCLILRLSFLSRFFVSNNLHLVLSSPT